MNLHLTPGPWLYTGSGIVRNAVGEEVCRMPAGNLHRSDGAAIAVAPEALALLLKLHEMSEPGSSARKEIDHVLGKAGIR